MVAAVPQTEPARIVAGDSLHWQIDLPDYLPADGWVLKYHAVNATANFNITSTTSGAVHDVAVTAVTTAAYAAGTYTLTAYVEGPSSQRVTLYSRALEVAPNLATATGLDARTPARQILEALQALYRSHVTGGRALIGEYDVAGRRMKFVSTEDLLAQISYWKQEAAREEAALAQQQGLSGRRRVLVRFG
jgi:hypothetical protein